MKDPFDEFFNETHPKGRAVWEEDDIPLHDTFVDQDEM